MTIPSEFGKAVGVRAGDNVKVEVAVDQGKITYSFSGAKQLPLAENFLRPKRK